MSLRQTVSFIIMALLDHARTFGPASATRIPLRFAVIAGVALLILFSFLIVPKDSRPNLPKWSPHNATGATKEGAIPNQVHFVYILPETNSNFMFEFSHFLSIYAAWHHWKPDAIFLHTNADANSDAVLRARSGAQGKWNRYIFTLFNIQINTVVTPTRAGNGKDLVNMEHKSDFVRVKAVHDLGGVYIDWDVHALRDIAPLRNAGFRAVGGQQSNGELNSGTFLSVAGGRMISLWMERMNKVYDGQWSTHSNGVLTAVGQRLVREPGEMLNLERDAFAPGGWSEQEHKWLWQVHNDTKSNLEGIHQGDPLPSYEEEFEDRWKHKDRFPDWDRDWSGTWLLHAFSPARHHREINGFKHVTPRYVLARQSNFARGVYPIAKMMYERGLIRIDDSHTGMEEESVPV